ncbi:HelD family protein [Actinoplanes sp. URMC 104]|uniref:HelD family protein n=1 Tax=Actinoplanes sp. URMC 104 TaxID=3423409 RepID=UPI003F1C18C6
MSAAGALDEDREAPGPPDDPLLAELARATTEAGPDFVATIRAGQDDLIRTPPGSVLVIQGGPGTGKTDTALRRVARLLAGPGCELTPGEVLVVGPSAAFARHTRALLDAWGHEGVTHTGVDDLLPKAATGRPEAPHVTRLKGEARMAGLLERAIGKRRERQSVLPAVVTVRGRPVRLDPATVRRVITTAEASEATPGDRRRLLRAALVAGTQDPRLILDAADLLADRLWPEFDAATFLTELFGSRALLAEAAGGEFTDREIGALYRAADADPPFSDADLPLLDEAAHLAGEEPQTYGHVVVDEAQDYSPMQLRAISRRSANGSLTVVGDMAQSTGPWARDDWHDVLAHLPSRLPHEHRELRFGYRVPRQIFELAAELLPTAAPSVQPPTTVRDGPSDPVIAPVGPADRAAVVVAAAAGHAAEGRSVAIVSPAACHDEIAALLRAEDLPWRTSLDDQPGHAITLLTPHEAKGLEFDAAVVVEPGLIVDEDPRGHRLLYIALTRATAHLHLVGALEDLPAAASPAAPAQPSPAATSPDAAPAQPSPAPTSQTSPAFAAVSPAPASQTSPIPAATSPAPASQTSPIPAAVSPAAASQTSPAPAAVAAASPAAAPAEPESPSPSPEVPLDPAVREQIDAVAHALAETMLVLTPDLWPAALDRLIELISPDS